jgi:hypothetical protein
VSADGLNPDGSVPLALKVTLADPHLSNLTALVPTVGADLTVGKIHLSALGTSFNTTVFKKSVNIPLGNITIFKSNFSLAAHGSTPAAFTQQTKTGLTAT